MSMHRWRFVLIGLALTAFAEPAMTASLCADVVLVAEQNPGGLSIYRDDQIRRGMCLTTKMATEAIASGDAVEQESCLSAAGYVMKEFAKRFPGEDPGSVAGTC